MDAWPRARTAARIDSSMARFPDRIMAASFAFMSLCMHETVLLGVDPEGPAQSDPDLQLQRWLEGCAPCPMLPYFPFQWSTVVQ